MLCSSLNHAGEFKVLSAEGNPWRVGVYRPRFQARSQITGLEQHSCQESFLLIQGQITMLYRNSLGELIEKELQPLELVTFTEPHAGFSSAGDGVALVVEDAFFETVYTDINNGKELRRVKVP